MAGLLLSSWLAHSSSNSMARRSYAGVAGDAPLQRAEAVEAVACVTAAHAIPHPTKAHKPGGSGEDAFFVAAGGRVFGVADGVGGWASVGVDPSLYSRALMAAAAQAAAADPEQRLTPREVLQRAYEAPGTRAVVGTSTACVASLRGSTLRVANLGDSGALVVRDGGVAHRTREQQHSFNCPYQLGTDSEDTPAMADQYEWNGVRQGDVVVLGTDGLWDNLFDHAIAREVADYLAAKPAARPADLRRASHELAQRIAVKALAAANSATARTPFWSKPDGPRGYGGKLDDICVVVAIAAAAEHAQSQTRAASPPLDERL